MGHPMKILAAVFALIFCSALSIGAQEKEENEKKVSADVRISGGAFFGNNDFIITKEANDEHVHSLDLDEISVPFIGLDGELSVYNFVFGLSILSGIPVKLGDITEESTDIFGKKSLHTAFSTVDSHLSLHAFASYKFKAGNLSILPKIGFSYIYRKWSATDGTNGKMQFFGTLLSFAESTWYPTIGGEFCYAISNAFILGLSGNVYPYMNVTAKENREFYNDQFYAKLGGGIGGDVYFSAEYRKPLSSFSARLRIGYEGFRSGKGDFSVGPMGYNPPFVKDESFKSEYCGSLFVVSIGIGLII
ncbi:MAG: hypothetical protein Ta2G_09140 [Termitinemataceae bacterium]|nr:MAG: hypothetical protein Ta2G_09140 [Termitinemataceae bacterium]